MTTRSRIAMFLSTLALCLGLAAAPSAFAAGSSHSSTKHKADKAAPAKPVTSKHNAGETKAHKAK